MYCSLIVAVEVIVLYWLQYLWEQGRRPKIGSVMYLGNSWKTAMTELTLWGAAPERAQLETQLPRRRGNLSFLMIWLVSFVNIHLACPNHFNCFFKVGCWTWTAIDPKMTSLWQSLNNQICHWLDSSPHQIQLRLISTHRQWDTDLALNMLQLSQHTTSYIVISNLPHFEPSSYIRGHHCSQSQCLQNLNIDEDRFLASRLVYM